MEICPICRNDDPSLFAFRNNEKYCRACVGLLGKIVDQENEIEYVDSTISYDFELTEKQKSIAQKLVEVGLKGDCLVEAVCGAGKTEICLELVSYALNQGLKVGWMVARRQVVLQLQHRLASMFQGMSVVCVTGGHTKDLVGDLIVMTAHQLYRYPHRFDLLIIDEPDAFPYKGNQLLEGLVEVACIGTKVFLSATPDANLIKQVDYHLKLDSRPHGRELVVPKVIKTFGSIEFLSLIHFRMKLKRLLIFVPTKKLAKKLGIILRCEVVTSSTTNKDELIHKFNLGDIDCLITTTVLERGVTFSGCNVVVYHASHLIFDEASLIQISGRVDRSFEYKEGVCIFLCHSYSTSIKSCINRIKAHNHAAYGV